MAALLFPEPSRPGSRTLAGVSQDRSEVRRCRAGPDEFVHHEGIDHRPGLRHRVDGLGQLIGAGHALLEQVGPPADPVSNRASACAGAVNWLRTTTPDLGTVLTQPRGGLNALVGPGGWHPDIGDHDIGFFLLDQLEKLRQIARRPTSFRSCRPIREMPSRSRTLSSASATRILPIAADRSGPAAGGGGIPPAVVPALLRGGPVPAHNGCHARARPSRSAASSAAPRLAFYLWRGTFRRTWPATLAIMLISGLLGAVALAAVAGARRTDSAYGRYLTYIRASDAFVNVPGQVPGLPISQPIEDIAGLPGISSAAAYVGLNANPVVRGRVVDSFVTDSLTGSYALPHIATSYFSQDRMTVLAGRLPARSATGEIALTPGIARLFHVGVGGQVTYQFYKVNPLTYATKATGRHTCSRWRRSWTSPPVLLRPDRRGGQRRSAPGRHPAPARLLRVRLGRRAPAARPSRDPGAPAPPGRAGAPGTAASARRDAPEAARPDLRHQELRSAGGSVQQAIRATGHRPGHLRGRVGGGGLAGARRPGPRPAAEPVGPRHARLSCAHSARPRGARPRLALAGPGPVFATGLASAIREPWPGPIAAVAAGAQSGRYAPVRPAVRGVQARRPGSCSAAQPGSCCCSAAVLVRGGHGRAGGPAAERIREPRADGRPCCRRSAAAAGPARGTGA